jgi:hypothetical protein
MKYMLMFHAAQHTYDLMSGTSTGYPDVKPEDFGPMYAFLEQWNQELAESGEFVDAQGLASPALTRRIQLKNGVPVVTDGPYAETEEVLASYTIVECESMDRATEIAARLSKCPYPANAWSELIVDIRPIFDPRAEPDA